MVAYSPVSQTWTHDNMRRSVARPETDREPTSSLCTLQPSFPRCPYTKEITKEIYKTERCRLLQRGEFDPSSEPGNATD